MTLSSPRHGMERKEIAQETQTNRKKKSRSEELMDQSSRNGDHSRHRKAVCWQGLGIASVFQEKKGIFSSFRSLLIERTFIMLTL